MARDGILPGRFGYEAGQAAVGDMLGWYARTLGTSHAGLEAAAARLVPGAAGLVALDWWSGTRSILADADLTGASVGLGLHTSQAEIYRALIESIALGNRCIIENFVSHGIPVERIVACGGIAVKSPLTMQIVADVSGLPVSVPASAQVPARGAALFGAVAAGVFPDIDAAVSKTTPAVARIYTPDSGAVAVYDEIYAIYTELYGLLGERHRELMHRIKRLATERR